jgi:hypothetical protein
MKIIITIEDGMLTGVYADSEDVSVELLDYDNFSAAQNDADEYAQAAEEAAWYGELEKELESGITAGTLVSHW